MKKPLFEITAADRLCYERELRDFLPRRIVDIHTHVWRATDFPAKTRRDPRVVSWPSRVAKDDPVEDLAETYRLLFPGKTVTPLMFATLPQGDNLDRQNRYVASCARRTGYPALLFTDPAWSASELESRMTRGGFIGAKSYLTVAPSYIPSKEVRIFDYFPPHQLEVYDRHGWIVMLHIPRDGRLRDPVNLAQLMEIDRAFPRARVIVAHVGRAYCDHDVGDAFAVLGRSRRLLFDISANTNARVFEQLIRTVGPRRILFGSDMPISRMRMRRVTEGDHYVNIVPKGLYGDVSGDRNMRETDGPEAAALTFFVYETIRAFRRAAARTGLSAREVADVFGNNARRLLQAAARG